MTGERIIETDVLVLGGGLAGCMAAIRASEHGVDVTVVEKSHVERSGAAGTGNDHFWHCGVCMMDCPTDAIRMSLPLWMRPVTKRVK